MSTREDFEGIIKYHQGRVCFKSMCDLDREKVVGGYALFCLLDNKPDKNDAEKTLMFNLFKRAHIILFYRNKGMRDCDVTELDNIINMLKQSLNIS